MAMVPLARRPHPLGVRRCRNGPVGPEATSVGGAPEWRWSRWPDGHIRWGCDGAGMVPLARRPQSLGVRWDDGGSVADKSAVAAINRALLLWRMGVRRRRNGPVGPMATIV